MDPNIITGSLFGGQVTIVRLLIEKKILTEEEILRKIQEVKSEHPNT
ncbi:MAG: hypothetical protein ACXAC2_24715 [Candidatus Kariarchaeaceae archaeon]